MAAKVFIDTNILFYAADKFGLEKGECARLLLAKVMRSNGIVLSSQVLQELASNAIKKLRLPPHGVKFMLANLPNHELVLVDQDIVNSALDLVEPFSLSYWDACIVAAALEAKCKVLYTEDLQHGMKIGTLRVENPFLAAT